MAKQTSVERGWVNGEPKLYVRGHQASRQTLDLYDIDERGCWIWRGDTGANGYGRITIARRRLGAHVVFYERHVGPIPDGYEVHHHCEVRNCVNPRHLEALSKTDHRRLHNPDGVGR